MSEDVSRSLTTQTSNMPVSIAEMKRQAKQIHELMKEVMRENVDYGKIPGCPKPSLWQPGAEKTCFMFGLYVDTVVSETFDPTRTKSYVDKYKKDQEREGYYEVMAMAYLKRKGDDFIVATATATANNFEKKYIGQDVYDMKNTIMAMAQKRAYVRVVRNGTAASDVFTDPDIPEGLLDEQEGTPEQRQSSVKEKAPAAAKEPEYIPPDKTPPAQQTPADSGECASTAQIRMLYAKQKNAKVPDEVFNDFLKDNGATSDPDTGKADVSTLLKSKVNTVVKLIDEYVPFG